MTTKVTANGQKIIGVAAPTPGSTDAANALYAESVATTAAQSEANLRIAAAALSATLAVNGQTITNLADPTTATGAVNLQTLQAYAAGISTRSARLATAAVLPGAPVYANGVAGVGATLIGTTAIGMINGVTPNLLDRILVKNQAAQETNGVYVLTASTGLAYTLTRAADADTNKDLAGMLATVDTVLGASLSGTQWIFAADPDATTVGTTAIIFTAFQTTPQSMGGDISGTTASATVDKIKGTTVSTAGGALTTGQVLRVTGVATADWGALDLTNANAVSGALPATKGGTAQSAYAAGDVIYASALNTLSVRAGEAQFRAESAALTADPDLNGRKYTNLALPTAAAQAMVVPASIANGDMFAWVAGTLARFAQGTAKQFLQTPGDGTTPVWSSAVATVKIQALTGSGTYTASTGLLFAIMICTGNGGGGGGAAGSATGFAGGGGGASGTTSIKVVSGATVGATQTVTFGATGTGGTAGNNGTAGGDVQIGTLCLAKGGGSGGGAAANSSGGGANGANGAAGTGDVLIGSGGGGDGQGSTLTTSNLYSGAGGGSFWGGPGKPVVGQNTGANGQAYGSGGGGGACQGNGTGTSGGTGKTGLALIIEFCDR